MYQLHPWNCSQQRKIEHKIVREKPEGDGLFPCTHVGVPDLPLRVGICLREFDRRIVWPDYLKHTLSNWHHCPGVGWQQWAEQESPGHKRRNYNQDETPF